MISTERMDEILRLSDVAVGVDGSPLPTGAVRFAPALRTAAELFDTLATTGATAA